MVEKEDVILEGEMTAGAEVIVVGETVEETEGTEQHDISAIMKPT